MCISPGERSAPGASCRAGPSRPSPALAASRHPSQPAGRDFCATRPPLMHRQEPGPLEACGGPARTPGENPHPVAATRGGREPGPRGPTYARRRPVPFIKLWRRSPHPKSPRGRYALPGGRTGGARRGGEAGRSGPPAAPACRSARPARSSGAGNALVPATSGSADLLRRRARASASPACRNWTEGAATARRSAARGTAPPSVFGARPRPSPCHGPRTRRLRVMPARLQEFCRTRRSPSRRAGG